MPDVARMYGYSLGGSHHVAADRGFLRHAVARSLDLGTRQFPDADGLVEVRRWAVPPPDAPFGLYAVTTEPLA